jgi:NhaP-type Na+/H+ and K+/H+ antiporter
MLLSLTSYHYIVIFSITIIISYFFNLYAKKSGIPAVLMLIGLGVFINYGLRFSGVEKPNLLPILEVLGVVGLILIVLEAALDLHLLKEKIGLITKSFLVALLGFIGTAYLAALALAFLMDVPLLNAVFDGYKASTFFSSKGIDHNTIGDKNKREFMIYESTFSDIIGIVGFYSVLTMIGSASIEGVYGEMFSNLILTVIFSVIISYILIYVFQNIRGNVKLFLLIAILLLLFAVGKMFHLSSLIIILIFGVILNNYKVFFRGELIKLLNKERVDEVQQLNQLSPKKHFIVV